MRFWGCSRQKGVVSGGCLRFRHSLTPTSGIPIAHPTPNNLNKASPENAGILLRKSYVATLATSLCPPLYQKAAPRPLTWGPHENQLQQEGTNECARQPSWSSRMGGNAESPVRRDLGDRKAWAASSGAEVPIFSKLWIQVSELPSRTILGALCLGPFAASLRSCSKPSGLPVGLSPAPGSTFKAIRTLTSH